MFVLFMREGEVMLPDDPCLSGVLLHSQIASARARSLHNLAQLEYMPSDSRRHDD